MNKKELIDWVAENTGSSKIQAEQMVNATFDGILHGTKKDGSVTLIGFGTFKASQRKERNGRNPKTGESLVIPASISPVFSAGKAFKDSLNQV